MAKLQQRHPAVDLQLVATNRLCDLAREQIDLAIRYGTGEWRNLEVRQLMPELYFPVASAAFLRKHGARNPAELLKTSPIISNALHPDEWTEWCTAHGLQAPRTSNMISLSSAELVVPLFRDRAIGKAAYYLVRPRAGISSAVRKVADWLIEEAKASTEGEMLVAAGGAVNWGSSAAGGKSKKAKGRRA